MRRLAAALMIATLCLGPVTMAAAQMQHGDMKGMDKSSQTHKGTGVVTRIDRNAGKLTLKHDPIKSLNWPAMTMAFEVKDKALLDKAKQGDKVEFSLVQSGNKHIITDIK
jgi:Cu(I)/Ag(I) efflux system protein CusF